MGSSDDPNNSTNTNTNTKAIDASVGGLVWVRRRNGSWWPGRIMGLDEISEGSLVSPRSGTPVKLLGREDASVDWYNLEKSKRVKAFRCGEYDECIEKAKASAANGNKKAVKYARREDAILHALEIENARLGKDRPDFFSRTNNSGEEHCSTAKESPSISLSGKEDDVMTDEESDSKDDADADADSDSDSALDSDSDSAPELSQSGISFEEPHIGASKVQSIQEKRRRTPNDSEDDGTEGIKRMRGLEDLGIGVGDSNTGNCVPNGSPVNGTKGHNSSLKRKRTQVSNVHEFLKRRNRRRPLTKVLESTAMVSIPVVCDQLPSSNGSPLQGLSDSKVSGMESNESRKSFCVAINNNSDSTGVSSENGASLNPSEHAYDASHTSCKLKEKDISDISRLTENDSLDRLFDVPFVGEEKRSTGFSPTYVSSSSGRHQVGGLGRESSQNIQAEAVPLKIEGLNESNSTSLAATHVNNISQRIEKGSSKWQLKGKRNSRHTSKNRRQDSRKYVDMDDESNAYLAGRENLDGFLHGSDRTVDCDGTLRSLASYNCNLHVKSKPFPEDHVEGVREWGKSFSHRESHMRGSTADMSLPPQRFLPYRQSRFTVNSRYQTSDFPGRTFCTASKLFDVKLEVKANYRPQHVPLVSLMSKLNGKAIVGHPLTAELLSDGYCDRLISSNECDSTHVTVLKAAKPVYLPLRNLEAVRVPRLMKTQPHFSTNRSLKLRKCGLLSKKTRKLSSLTGNKDEDRKPVMEKPKGPVIACIPLKLVFSRINEAVNGSARQAHRALTSTSS